MAIVGSMYLKTSDNLPYVVWNAQYGYARKLVGSEHGVTSPSTWPDGSAWNSKPIGTILLNKPSFGNPRFYWRSSALYYATTNYLTTTTKPQGAMWFDETSGTPESSSYRKLCFSFNGGLYYLNMY